MKKLLIFFLKISNKLMYRKYKFEKTVYSQNLIFKTGFFQKIIGFNRNIYWPVHRSTTFLSPENIEIGNRCNGLAKNCHFDARNGIIIGDNVWMAHGVNLISQNHNNDNYNVYEKSKPIKIRNNCLLGANCIILSGVEIGEHTIVAAGAIVTKSFSGSNQILAGNPAKIVKKIESYKG